MAPASIRDVAALAGVSVGTVSNVLNRSDRVSPGVTSRVHDAMRELGYVRNDAARHLRSGRSKSIGLIVLDVRNPFFTDLARGAEIAAARHGLSVLVGNSDSDRGREQTYLDLFQEQRVLGILLSPAGGVDTRIEQLGRSRTPVVLVDQQSAGDLVSSVSVDDVAGGGMAAAHLLEGGRRRFVYVGGPVRIRQVADRIRGARMAVRRTAGTSFEVIETIENNVFEGRRIGEAILARGRSERPDAIIAANDLLALGLLQALVMAGAQLVPDEIALIGYDDIEFAASAIVPLSSIRQPSQLIGETAIELLLEITEGDGAQPRSVVFQPELVVRESSTSADAATAPRR